MQVRFKGLHLAVMVVLTLALASMGTPARAAPPPEHDLTDVVQFGQDNLAHPLGKRLTQERQQGLQHLLAGQPTVSGSQGRVIQLAKNRYAELVREDTDRVFVLLAEFGNQSHPDFPNGTDGPLHNQIAQPDRQTDNTTIWQADYNREHYEELYFSSEAGVDSMVNYYNEQSSGRYTIEGAVVDWVKAPYNAARYGRNFCGSIICANVWELIRDGINVWTEEQLAAGRTLDEVRAELQSFDEWDRYDYDSDGNFDEPDGYIDHFQIVHAGEGEETGGGAQGADAIWSHRWYAYFNGIGTSGPAYNPQGGTQFGEAGIWVGDYTIQPENGGLGVFAHEYAHDLGLPDEYDTSGTGESSAAFWTLMSTGSYLNDGTSSIGGQPSHLNAWGKLQLGWLNYTVVQAGETRTVALGPSVFSPRRPQALVVTLPPKEVQTALAPPYAGSMAWWSGKGDNLDNNLTRALSLPAGQAAALSLQAWYNIEVDWDYAYIEVSNDSGTTWSQLETNVSTDTNPNGQNFGNGITGVSGGWVAVNADLSAYAGQNILLRLRYWTDGAVQGLGFLADQIQVVAGGATLFSDGAEAGENGWTLNGFKATTGVESSFFNHYYIAESRQYKGYDAFLEAGPYNFGFRNTLPNYVERFPYQDGLLISYWDTSMTNNNVGQHPGEGLILPIDAHPTPLIGPDGQPWRTRLQVYDATFGLEPTDPVTWHLNDVPASHPSLPAEPVFNDLNDYWFPSKPDAGVKVPKTGTIIEVLRQTRNKNLTYVQVRPAQ
ncbi:MAG: immune inhibitor A [Chloroflexales bacterium]|nr:immune inhibitor A [Chloroflexales bacterium]